ncbi:rhomboid family domain-containing protein [Ditylenchus destructor]|uniref:rhomboid protease n=1 Tax=Ditylenchus destructor TaxID=166010 RepID=A0AAD4R865_9BILA|nr:rhomboid family domain-containing protein [Ditylenchus destructor]
MLSRIGPQLCCLRPSISQVSALQKKFSSANFSNVRSFSLNIAKLNRPNRSQLRKQFDRRQNFKNVENMEAEAGQARDSIPVSAAVFVFAAKYDYENAKKRTTDFFSSWTNFDEFFGKKQQSRHSDNLPELTPGLKYVLGIVAICGGVTLAWRIPGAQQIMWRYFTNGVASKSLCWPMLWSVFSHKSLIHLVLNMYVLFTFAPLAIDKFLGVGQFNALYIAGGLSGAILAVLIYTCMKMPEARLSIVFLPFFTFSAEQAVYGIIIFDLMGLLFKFKLFDHAAHLGGAIFGWLYAQYGEKWYRDIFQPYMFQTFKSIESK